jgi:hypothetical protein
MADVVMSNLAGNQGMPEIKLDLQRRPLLNSQKVIFSAPHQDQWDCCLCCTRCQICPSFCCAPDLYPPLLESAYTWVTPTGVTWNRPNMRPYEVDYFCYGCCVNKPNSSPCCTRAPGICPCSSTGDMYKVSDNIKTVYFDTFETARVASYFCGTPCGIECSPCCCGKKFLVLDEGRWAKCCCCSCGGWCDICPCQGGARVLKVHQDYLPKLAEQINRARAAAMQQVGGAFITPTDLSQYSRDKSIETDYLQPVSDAYTLPPSFTMG